ncbi:alpha/beta fold hydrolase [Antarcticibacterium arcticum]|uniref:Alpha/beta fold hydrolase n=1 Tax=Antarcticibacterium arcticum TaxID=2585771 RepID=A0A5B8YQ96_9FLAO|nr:alpha/beta fold hydrolase [Antarcticibacterium arcticum]QED38546.1 alpha/beta fold hydrolase [Antarcticibacterium arcticum]
MPLLKSNYNPPVIFRNYHLSTIYASMFRSVPEISQKRERLELEDGDFLDIDWSFSSKASSKKLQIILHGLEGNSSRPYVVGMANHFNEAGWDVAAINLRGCSGELNRLYRSYNAGASEDLREVIKYVLENNNYDTLSLTGFSLGGNLMLKYLGEGKEIPPQLKAAVAISTPCDLYLSLKKLEETKNYLYSRRFVKKLKQQLLIRSEQFPDKITRAEIMKCNTLYAIDDLYTGKAHGFQNARDYYEKSSALNFIPSINIPTLLINAKNDAFLSPNSSPVELAIEHQYFHLELPAYGGHVGFLQNKKTTFAEERALAFITENS